MPIARDIMSRTVHTIARDASICDAVHMMNEYSASSLIVEPQSESDTYGIVTMRDVVYKTVAKGRDIHQVKVYEVMTKPLIVVLPDLSVKHTARLLANCKVSRAPVIENGKLVGMVRLKDILADLHLVDSMK